MLLPLTLWTACAATLALADASKRSFENTNIQRTIELGGALTHVTTTYNIRATGELGPNVYTFALSKAEEDNTSWMELKMKKAAGNELLEVQKFGFNPKSNAYLYTVDLPPMAHNSNATLVLNTILTHAATPYPASIAQGDQQLLKFETDLFVPSPYPTVSEKLKIRTPTANVASYSSWFDFKKYLDSSEDSERVGIRAGSLITYGPFSNLPSTTGLKFQNNEQRTVAIHYEYGQPVITLVEYRRHAEISHWGANLNIEDKVVLRNDGPKLKGHFSRLEHQQARYFQKIGAQTLSSIVQELPAGIHQPYYYDLIGNVSTSRFRPSPRLPKSSKRPQKGGILEWRPRYPVMGGWNYTYTIGWDAPLEHSVVWDKEHGQYIAAIPFMTVIAGAAVEDAELKVVLPEGATNVHIHPPFTMDYLKKETHITYLDTVGRPAVIFHKKNLTDKHDGIVYISYNVPFTAHLTKPVAVGAAAFALFILTMVARRIDVRLNVENSKGKIKTK